MCLRDLLPFLSASTTAAMVMMMLNLAGSLLLLRMDQLGAGAFLKNPATDRQLASGRNPRQPDAASFSARASATRSQNDH